MLQRKLSRIIIGIALLGHGANVVMVTSGKRGRAPLIGNGPTDGLADPLPQALALTAIVISFGVTALLLALAYRNWLLTSDDEVQDDVEDRDVALHGAPDVELADDEDADEDEEVAWSCSACRSCCRSGGLSILAALAPCSGPSA